MENIREQIREIKQQLRSLMNGAASASMREKGLNYKVNFGVELPRLKQLAAGYEKNHQLAGELWKEDIRESKILAAMLQPVESFYPEIADIWVDDIRTMEIAELTVMNLFQHLEYAPQLSFQWISSETEFRQVCGYLLIARLLSKKGDMDERTENEFLDQAVTAFLSGSYNVRTAVLRALTKYATYEEEHAFRLCRKTEDLKDSTTEQGQALYAWIRNLVSE
ncbi:MAG: DNA alkylation repair protein [Bacteroidaceae bacterium]|nr:DNA alkylation repair protein [Bacteroidaceae bacterium]